MCTARPRRTAPRHRTVVPQPIRKPEQANGWVWLRLRLPFLFLLFPMRCGLLGTILDMDPAG
jgi:hypothetical protein